MDTVAATLAQSTTSRPAAGGPTPDGAKGASFLDLLFAAQAGAEGTPFAGMVPPEGSADATKTSSALDRRGGEGMPAAHFLDMLLQGASPMAVATGLTAGTAATAPGGTGTGGTTAAPGTTMIAGAAPTEPATASQGTGAGTAATGTGATAETVGGAAATIATPSTATPATGTRTTTAPTTTGPAGAPRTNAATTAGGTAPQTHVQQAAATAEAAIVQAGGAVPPLPTDSGGNAAKAGLSIAAIAAGTAGIRSGIAGTGIAATASTNPSVKPGTSDASTAGQTSAAKAAGPGLRAPEVAMVDRPQPGADYASLARADQAAFADAEATRQNDADGGFDRLLQGAHGTNGGRGALGGPPTVSGAATPRAVHVPVPPMNQVAVQIATAARNGVERISLQLDPAELGRIDVSLDIAEDGHVTARVTADRPETLDMLQRDSRGLEKALQDAGLKMGGDSLSFDLREQGEQQPSLAEDTGRGRGTPGDDGSLAADPGAMDAAFRYLDSNRALDIRV